MTPGLAIENPAYFDRLAEIETGHWWSLGMWRLASYWLTSALKGRTGLEALDVGCGTGFTMLRLRSLPEIDCVVGLDPSIEALEHARGRHDMPLFCGSAVALPFENASFDVITCFDVLQHVPEGEDGRAVEEMSRVLRPGGVVLIRSNARPSWSRTPRATPCYRLVDLVSLFADTHFSVRRASYANALPALGQEVIGRIPRSRGGVRSHPSGGGLRIRLPHPRINRMMGAVSSLEAMIAGAWGIPLPFGHSTMLLAQKDSDSALAVNDRHRAPQEGR